MTHIYLDHAALTPTDPQVAKLVFELEAQGFGNASSLHQPAIRAQDALSWARTTIARAIGAHDNELIFTSGGTESDNIAILGIARAHTEGGKHIVSCKTEHPAVLESLRFLKEHEGFEVTLLDVDKEGRVRPADVVKAIREDTILVTIMTANNEIGTIHPIEDIGREILKWRKQHSGMYPFFHTDACQALGALELSVERMHVDAMSINASKIYGPKGVGALYVRRGVKIQPLCFGGEQERRLRPGTEPVASIGGFAKAVEIALEIREKEQSRLTALRDWFITELQKNILGVLLNGHPRERLANNIHVSFEGVEGEALLLYLDAKGIYVSSGSACTSQKLDPSHVVLALGRPHSVAHSSIRMSMGRTTTQADLAYVLKVLPELVQRLREVSTITQL